MAPTIKLPAFLFHPVSTPVLRAIAWLLGIGLYGIIILYFKVDQPDLKAHIEISNQIVDKHAFPVHPVFFGMIQVLSGFSKNYPLQLFAGFVLFSIAQYFKVVLSFRLLQEAFDLVPSYLLLGLVLLLQFAIPIPFFSENFMVKALSMNYFHNATLHCANPFSLALMLQLVRYHKTESAKNYRLAILFGVLNCLAKPSFIFCLVPVLPFVALYAFGMTPRLLRMVQLSTILVFVIMLQSAYLHSSAHAEELAQFKVRFQPFFLFGTLANHLRVLVEGFFIGFLLLIFFGKQIMRQFFTLSALGFVLLGYGIAFSFVDYVNNVISPNFTWQASITNYVFVLMGLGFVLPKGAGKEITLPGLIIILALVAHAVCGLLYLRMACLLRIFYLSM